VAKADDRYESPSNCRMQEPPTQLERPLSYLQSKGIAGPDTPGVPAFGLQDLVDLDDYIPLGLDGRLLSSELAGRSGRLHASNGWHGRTPSISPSVNS
jgi:hypothetical protein